jgi:hypothetical protein
MVGIFFVCPGTHKPYKRECTRMTTFGAVLLILITEASQAIFLPSRAILTITTITTEEWSRLIKPQ